VVSTFQFLGTIGFVVGVGTGLLVVDERHLPASTLAIVTVTSVVTFFALSVATAVVEGEGRLTFYHHAAAITAAIAVAVAVDGQPVRPWLDVSAIGIGAFLVFGRIGCLTVGCCHGRPSDRGVVYGPEHVEAGMPLVWEGVTLFPLQAVESLAVAALTAVALATELGGGPAGLPFAVLASGYAGSRAVIELFRGDGVRPYRLGASAAQWTSVAVAATIAGMQLTGALPGPPVSLIPAGVAVAVVGWSVAHRSSPASPIGVCGPAHLEELLGAIHRARAVVAGDTLVVMTTSQGVRVSVGVTGPDLHYALSSELVPSSTLATLAGRLARILSSDGPGEQLLSPSGVHHVHLAGVLPS
jgi:prolipoprotein diacylglyceryltransferase